MWLSRNFKNPEQSAAENGVVTLSAENITEANSSLPSRTSECFRLTVILFVCRWGKRF